MISIKTYEEINKEFNGKSKIEDNSKMKKIMEGYKQDELEMYRIKNEILEGAFTAKKILKNYQAQIKRLEMMQNIKDEIAHHQFLKIKIMELIEKKQAEKKA